MSCYCIPEHHALEDIRFGLLLRIRESHQHLDACIVSVEKCKQELAEYQRQLRRFNETKTATPE